jgi:hypothetical protein
MLAAWPVPARHPAEHARLCDGLVPEEMEDKWFIVFDGGALWFHRSWTGLCVYRVRFAEEDGRFRVSEAIMNRDPAQYRSTDDAHDADLVARIMDGLLRLEGPRSA